MVNSKHRIQRRLHIGACGFANRPFGKLSSSSARFYIEDRGDHWMRCKRCTMRRDSSCCLSTRGEAISREISAMIEWRASKLGSDLELDTSEQATTENKLLRMERRTCHWLRLIVEMIRDEIVLTKRRMERSVYGIWTIVDQVYEATRPKSTRGITKEHRITWQSNI